MSENNVLGQRMRKVNIDYNLAERVNREVAEENKRLLREARKLAEEKAKFVADAKKLAEERAKELSALPKPERNEIYDLSWRQIFLRPYDTFLEDHFKNYNGGDLNIRLHGEWSCLSPTPSAPDSSIAIGGLIMLYKGLEDMCKKKDKPHGKIIISSSEPEDEWIARVVHTANLDKILTFNYIPKPKQ